MDKKINLFLDCGAFSAVTQNTSIDIQEYINFIKENIDYIEIYSSLDVIDDANASYNNFCIMKQNKLSPIPCFHYGEDTLWLQKYLDEKCSYIALGGLVGKTSQSSLAPWLDYLFSTYLTDKDGLPIVKVHGFGLTSPLLICRYPWFSIDSSTWAKAAAYGEVILPHKNLNKLYRLGVSNRLSGMRQSDRHYTNLSKLEQKSVNKYLLDNNFEMGYSEIIDVPVSYVLNDNEVFITKDKNKIERIIKLGISNSAFERRKINMLYFINLSKQIPKWPWKFNKKKNNRFFL